MSYAPELHAPAKTPFDDGTIPVLARWVGSWQISLRRRVLSQQELTRSYDRVAPGWSRTLERLGVPGAYESMLRHALGEEMAVAGAAAPRRVLDCGIGTGALSLALAGVAPAPFALDAIDISPRMLERAGGALCDSSLAVSLRQADIRDLPYGDSLFDIAMTAHVLEHLVDPQVAIAEVLRVLKPGGLMIACITRRSVLGFYVNLRWRTHRVTPDEAEAWLRDCGLENVRSLSFGKRGFCRRLSVALVARKPL
ncbi:class I SAM-dependent methyltransferase [Pelagibius sp.]|uniref:class I SAM-dependent methyltransferase n=1 Tax=Pelagibius sp. TaxID=1931238 RepID=UPI002621E193|nr:methyltransferase domain-containing protein [Pelagibius sp.]